MFQNCPCHCIVIVKAESQKMLKSKIKFSAALVLLFDLDKHTIWPCNGNQSQLPLEAHLSHNHAKHEPSFLFSLATEASQPKTK